jgi:undecaprenyl-diphosphatase
MTSVIGYGVLLLILLPLIERKKWRLLFGAAIFLVLAIGFSRLALGVHYITDVLGGYALGGAWLAASTAAFSIWREERADEEPDGLEVVEHQG